MTGAYRTGAVGVSVVVIESIDALLNCSNVTVLGMVTVIHVCPCGAYKVAHNFGAFAQQECILSRGMHDLLCTLHRMRAKGPQVD